MPKDLPWNPHYPKPSHPEPVHARKMLCNGFYMVRIPSYGATAFIIDDFGNLVDFNAQTAEHIARNYHHERAAP